MNRESLELTGLDSMDRVCHELRQPLAVIHAFAELLADEVSGSLNDGQRDQVLTIMNAADELALSVHSLWGLAEIDQGRLRLLSDLRDLNDVCRDLYESYAQRFEAADVGLALQLAEQGAALVEVDENRLQLAVAHLLENGLKHTPPGRVVTIEVGVDPGTATVCVRDSGRGIAREDLERIFERFVRVEGEDSPSAAQGAGIGLTLCRAYVEAMGGRVWAESEPGAGARFRIELPTAMARAAPSA